MKMKNKTAENININNFFYKLGIVLIFILFIFVIIIKIFQVNLLKFPIPCVINKVTGYFCPGCGSTRAVWSLFHGHILTSLNYHPIVFYGAFLFVWFMFTNTIEKLSKGKLQIGMNYRDCYIWIGIGVIICNFLIKNVTIFLTGTPGF